MPTIKYVNHNLSYELRKYGNWIDLAAAKNYSLSYLDSTLIDLGISMELPKWYKAEMKPRSSTFAKYGIIMTNSIGEIDTEYCGHNDRWKFAALCLCNHSAILRSSRLAQFTIKLREDAPWYMKIKDLFTKIKLKRVDLLTGIPRGGFGSTGD